MIYLVRHGEAAASWGDHPDPGLSPLGCKQAEAASEQLMSYGVSAALSSPMQRCRETARPFEATAGLTALVEPVVSEISTPPEVEDRVPWLRTLMSGTWSEEGRDFLVWRKAMVDRLSRLEGGTVVFTHFVAINAIVADLMEDERVTVFRPGHCSITKLDKVDGRLKVAELGSESATRVL